MEDVNMLGSRKTRITVFLFSTIVFLLLNIEPSVANENGWVRLVRPDSERPFVEIPEYWLEYLENNQDLYRKNQEPPISSSFEEETPYEIPPKNDNVFRAIASSEINDVAPESPTETPVETSLILEETEAPDYLFLGKELPYEQYPNDNDAIPVIDSNGINHFDPTSPPEPNVEKPTEAIFIEDRTETPDITSEFSSYDNDENNSPEVLENAPIEGNMNAAGSYENAFDINAPYPFLFESSNDSAAKTLPSEYEVILNGSEEGDILITTPAPVPSDESIAYSVPLTNDDIAPEPSTPGPDREFQDPISYTEILPAFTLDASEQPTYYTDGIEPPESTDSLPPFSTLESPNLVSPTEVLPLLPATQEIITSSPILPGENSTSEFPYPSSDSDIKPSAYPIFPLPPTLSTKTDIQSSPPNFTPYEHDPIPPMSTLFNPPHPRKDFASNTPKYYLPKPPPYSYYPPYYPPYYAPPRPRIPPPFAPRFNPVPQCYCPPRHYRK